MSEPLVELPEEDRHVAERRERRSVSRSAFKVGAGSMVSMLAGFMSQVIIAAYFGAGMAMDTYLTAVVVPAYLTAVLLAGLSFVFVPAFIEGVQTGREDDAWALVGTFFWMILATLTAVAVAVAFGATSIIRLIAPGMDPLQAQVASKMLSIMVFAVPLSGLGMLSMSILTAQKKFFLTTAKGAMLSIANIVVLLLFYDRLGAYALAWGYLAGIAADSAVVTFLIVRHGWPYLKRPNDPEVRQLLGLLLPFMLIGVFTRITPVIERYFASGLPAGQLSYIGYAERVVRIFNGLLATTFVTAIFPVMAQAYSQRGDRGLLSQLRYGVRLNVAVGLPVVTIVSALAVPLITLLFQRGAFDAAATSAVARVLPITLTRVVLLAMVGNVLTRVFYVLKETRTVPIVVASTVIVYVLLGAWWSGLWGYIGLVGAEAAYAFTGIVVLVWLLARRYQQRVFPPILSLRYLLRYLIPAVVAGLTAWGLKNLLTATPSFVQLAVGGLGGAGIYMALLHWLDGDMATAIWDTSGVTRLTDRIRARRIRQQQRLKSV